MTVSDKHVISIHNLRYFKFVKLINNQRNIIHYVVFITHFPITLIRHIPGKHGKRLYSEYQKAHLKFLVYCMSLTTLTVLPPPPNPIAHSRTGYI